MPDMADVDDGCFRLSGSMALPIKPFQFTAFSPASDPLVPGAFCAARMVYYTLLGVVGDIVHCDCCACDKVKRSTLVVKRAY